MVNFAFDLPSTQAFEGPMPHFTISIFQHGSRPERNRFQSRRRKRKAPPSQANEGTPGPKKGMQGRGVYGR